MSLATTFDIVKKQGIYQGTRFFLGNVIYDIVGSRGLYQVSTHYLADCLRCYGPLNVEGKTVVDIGCDYGNSIIFWWLRGAKEIIAFEKDGKFQERLQEMTNVPMKFMGEWKGEYPKGDVLKVDIDGPEEMFDLDKLDQYEQWAFAVHELGGGINTYHLTEGLAKHGGRRYHYQANAHKDSEEVWIKA